MEKIGLNLVSNLELEIIGEEKTVRDMNSAKILKDSIQTGGVIK